jgi:hypothetical protein
VRSQRLAVTAPRSVELNEDIFVVIDDFLLPVFANKDFNGSFLGGGNFFRLEIFGKGSSVIRGNKIRDGGG